VGHVHEGTLRRMVDEPLAVPDAAAGHVRGCVRCQVRSERVAEDAVAAQRLLVRPRPVPDVDRAWERHLGGAGAAGRADHREGALSVARVRRRRWRVMGATFGGGATVAVAGVVVVGAAAAATMTTVFAPTRVVPVPVDQGDLQAFSSALGLHGVLGIHHASSRAGTGTSTAPAGGGATDGGTTATATGTGTGTGATVTRPWAYGTIAWGTPSRTRTSSLAAAEAATGLDVSLPSTLPAGVAGPPRLTVEQATTATVSFGPSAGAALDGSTLTVTVGPAVMARYGGTGVAGQVPTLAVLAMRRPTATAAGATVGELESFVLSQPGVPKDLAQDVRMLGDPVSALPVPIPPGATETSVTIGGAPGVLLAEAGGVASGAVWEDQQGVVRTVAGLLDQEDVLSVARQVG
jgi:hypothetical protein